MKFVLEMVEDIMGKGGNAGKGSKGEHVLHIHVFKRPPRKQSYENTVGKQENAGYQHFHNYQKST